MEVQFFQVYLRGPNRSFVIFNVYGRSVRNYDIISLATKQFQIHLVCRFAELQYGCCVVIPNEKVTMLQLLCVQFIFYLPCVMKDFRAFLPNPKPATNVGPAVGVSVWSGGLDSRYSHQNGKRLTKSPRQFWPEPEKLLMSDRLSLSQNSQIRCT